MKGWILKALKIILKNLLKTFARELIREFIRRVASELIDINFLIDKLKSPMDWLKSIFEDFF